MKWVKDKNNADKVLYADKCYQKATKYGCRFGFYSIGYRGAVPEVEKRHRTWQPTEVPADYTQADVLEFLLDSAEWAEEPEVNGGKVLGPQ